MKFRKTLDPPLLILHVTDNLTTLPRLRILVDRKIISCKISQDSYKLGKSCKILTKNSICKRFLDAMAFLQETVLYHKNLARNALVCSEDNLICREYLTIIYNFCFTKIGQKFGDWKFLYCVNYVYLIPCSIIIIRCKKV